MQNLGTLSGQGSKGLGMNDLGQIVGASSTLSGDNHAFLWEDGTMYDLGTLSGTEESAAFGINNLGQVAGECTSPVTIRAVLWQVPIRAAIDLMPGSSANSLKIDGKGKVQVAVNPASLTLGDEDARDTPVSQSNKSQPISVFKDVNGDGRVDLVVTFDLAALVQNGDLTASTTRLVLLGARKDGRPVRGRDAVVVS